MISIVGFGPGSEAQMTGEAREAIARAEIVVTYKTYRDLLETMFPDKTFLSTGMTKETERCELAIDHAKDGKNVTILSSGDAGVYGMAGLVFSLLEGQDLLGKIAVEVIPGVTAATAAAALLGAPLMHDFAVISLSDRLTPFELIQKRIRLAAEGDFVIVLYNPRSKGRPDHLENLVQEILKFRSSDTPVGLARQIGREGESKRIVTLGAIPYEDVDMLTTVIIGNSQTARVGDYMVTPRGYRADEALHD